MAVDTPRSPDVDSTPERRPLHKHHGGLICYGQFHRLYIRKVPEHTYRAKPKWTAIGYFCEKCKVFVLDADLP